MKPWIPFALSVTLLTACQSPSEPVDDSTWSETTPSITIPALQREGVTWSHLVDDASRQQLRKTMNRAGLSEASQQFFWDDVDRSLDYIDPSRRSVRRRTMRRRTRCLHRLQLPHYRIRSNARRVRHSDERRSALA